MPHNRNTVRVQIVLSVQQAQMLQQNSDMRLMMYCGLSPSMLPYAPVDITFPNQIEVKINDDDVKSNFKGLKNKPGSTKPADLTSKVRAKANYPNQVAVTYALTQTRYAFVIELVKYVSAAALTERIKHQHVIPKERVIEEMRKKNADPDIEATSFVMSLKDPVSTVRITLPVRSTVCAHTQCFDGAMFMQLMEQAPQWNCPVCSKTVSFQSLCVDKYFEDILKNTPRSIEKVDVEPDGEWRVIKEDERQQPNGAPKPRASYDDDFDDDLVEIDAPSNKPVNGVKQTASQSSPMGAPSSFTNTPPLSSREPSVAQSTNSAQRAGSKRPASSVIDLTLSDEDEQPVRSHKRQTTTALSATSAASTSASDQQGTQSSHPRAPPQQTYHNTPSSVPTDRYNQPSFRQADSHRPSNFGASTNGNSAAASSTTSHAGFTTREASPGRSGAGQRYLNSELRGTTPGQNGGHESPAQALPPLSNGMYMFGGQRPSNTGTPSWNTTAQPSRPSSGTPQQQSYSMRPSPAPSHDLPSPQQTSQQQQQQQSNGNNGGLRLPPVSSIDAFSTPTPPPASLQYGQGPSSVGFYGGWRSDATRGSEDSNPG